MKKIIKEYEVYSFDELTPEIQEKVIENNYDINIFGDWYEFVFDDYAEKIKENYGIEINNINFSGFNSQGDGASFECNIHVKNFLENNPDIVSSGMLEKINTLREYLKRDEDLYIAIKRSSHHYCHSRTMCVNYDAVLPDVSVAEYEAIKELGAYLLNKMRDNADDLYDELEKTYDIYTSEKEIAETLRNNVYEFLADGSRF